MTVRKAGRLFAKATTVEAWRTFEVTTTVQVLKPSGTTRIWIPLVLVRPAPFRLQAEGGTAKLTERMPDSLGIIAEEFPTGVTPVRTVTSRITIRNFAVNLSA